MGRKRDLFDFVTAIEKTIFSFIVLSFSIMSVAQVLLTDESWRNYLNFASRLESQKITINEWLPEEMPVSANTKDVGYITLKLEKYLSLPNTYILVNGREVKRFNTNTAVVQVRRGDIVELDGTYYNKPFDVSITAVSDNIKLPEKNKILQVDQDIVTIAEVRFVQ